MKTHQSHLSTYLRGIVSFLFCSNILYIPLTINAQDPFIPDRPGFSTGTFTVEPGVIYLEIGFEYSFSKASSSSSLPVTNIRFGVFEKVETFVGWDGVIISDNNFSLFDALPSLGFKYAILKSSNLNLTLLGVTKFSYEKPSLMLEPLIGLVWDYELSKWLELFGLNLAGFMENEVELELAFGLGISLSERLNAYVEYFNQNYPSSSLIEHGPEVGLSYRISKNVYADLYSGYRLGREGNIYMGIGFSKRF